MTSDSVYERLQSSAADGLYVLSDHQSVDVPGSGLNPIWLADATGSWTELTLEQIPSWRDRVSDAYYRWAVTDKALRAARRDCATMAGTYDVTGLRPGAQSFGRTPLVSWSPQTAVERHDEAIASGMRLAMRDMVDEIERSILQAYEILLLRGPHCVLERPTERGLKRVYQRRDENPDGWDRAWSSFMTKWRKSHTQADAGNLVTRYWSDAQLFMTQGYDRDALQQVNGFAAVLLTLRDHIAEGQSRAKPKLARLSDGVDSPGFAFEEGQALDITRAQLELVEAFFAEYLRMLSLSVNLKSKMAPMTW